MQPRRCDCKATGALTLNESFYFELDLKALQRSDFCDDRLLPSDQFGGTFGGGWTQIPAPSKEKAEPTLTVRLDCTTFVNGTIAVVSTQGSNEVGGAGTMKLI